METTSTVAAPSCCLVCVCSESQGSGCHPWVPSIRSDHRISAPSLSHCQGAPIAPLCGCASSGFQLLWDVHLPDLYWVIHLPLDGGLGGSALFAELSACLGFVFGRTANPQELLLLSEPGVGVLTSGLLCCQCHPPGVHVHGHGLCHHSLPADPAQCAHRGHLSVFAA